MCVPIIIGITIIKECLCFLFSFWGLGEEINNMPYLIFQTNHTWKDEAARPLYFSYCLQIPWNNSIAKQQSDIRCFCKIQNYWVHCWNSFYGIWCGQMVKKYNIYWLTLFLLGIKLLTWSCPSQDVWESVATLTSLPPTKALSLIFLMKSRPC